MRGQVWKIRRSSAGVLGDSPAVERRPDIACYAVRLHRADPGQWRNGLAVLSGETARNAVQPAVGGRFNSRPMMGVQFGNRVCGPSGRGAGAVEERQSLSCQGVLHRVAVAGAGGESSLSEHAGVLAGAGR